MRTALDFLLGATIAQATLGCSGGDSLPGGAGGAGDAGGVHKGGLVALACNDSLDEVYLAPELSEFNDSRRGDVVRCGKDLILDAGQIESALKKNGNPGKAVTTGVTIYRIAYRTARLDNHGISSGLSSALVFVPDALAATDVAVVTAHDAVGLGDQCAPSFDDQTTLGDTHTLNLAFAGAGFLTIAPDYAGFGYGGDPQGFSLAEDEAHSLLDATRAMANLLTVGDVPKKFVMVGQGQGGHAVLSAQSIASSYGGAGELSGVVAFAPLWFAPRTWGAYLSKNAGLTTTADGATVALTMTYFYAHAQLYDGVGSGLAPFASSLGQPVSDLLQKRCLVDVTTGVATLGATPTDIFDGPFAQSVSNCARNRGSACDHAPASTWDARFSADRPSSNESGADVLVFQGGADSDVTPDRAMCGQDKLERDFSKSKHPTATLTYCGDEGATHDSVVERDIDYARRWIAWKTTGGDAPEACLPFAPKDGSGKAIVCNPVPSNAD